MLACTSHGAELRRFRRAHITRAAIAVLLLIPLLYGAMYVWAFWNPTDKLDRMPVALVNQDVPARHGDTSLTVGNDLTKRLVDGHNLDWRVTDADDAASGIRDGRYYFSVTIPSDFSASVVSLGSEQPKSAQLQVTYNDANSFLASVLGRSALTEVRDAATATVGSGAIDKILVGLGSAKDGFAKGSDGAIALRDGLSTAKDGVTALQSGTNKLDAGAATLATGATSARDGASQLSDGATKASVGATAVDAGANKITSGAAALADGLKRASSGTDSLSSAASQLSDGATALTHGIQDLSTGSASLRDGAAKLASGTTAYVDGVVRAEAGIDALEQRLTSASPTQPGLVPSLRKASEGAQTLGAGAQQVDDGLAQLAASLPELEAALASPDPLVTGAARAKLEATVKKLAAGSRQVNQGLNAPMASSTPGLVAALGAMNEGAVKTLLPGVQQLHQGFTSTDPANPGLLAGARAIDAGAQSLATGATTLSSGTDKALAGAKRAQGALNQLSAGATTLASGQRDLSTGASALAHGAQDLTGGSGQLKDGTTKLAAGASSLADGTTKLADGANSLHEGTSTAAQSLPRLSSGLQELLQGAQTLGTKLGDGAAAVPGDDAAGRKHRSETIANAVVKDEQRVHTSETWGEGFAPFFIPLALWVGALITWLLLRPMPARALMSRANGVRITWAAFSPALLIGAGQVVILLTVMRVALGLEYDSLWGTAAFTMLSLAAFLAFQQLLQIAFGAAPGKFVSIALLMLQIATAGGTYPVETNPALLRSLHDVLPMSYVVTGLRQVITGGIEGRFWLSVAVLTGTLVVSLIASSMLAARRRVWTIGRLHPVLTLGG